ncbi:M48 family metalloprotease [Nocardia yamanashiensis]|uniref:M48 family metalloprotease n=1 Tax=Nocardia yamanashiensis TaxID=209247 RepID=UPI001E3539CB|nr:M48 family metalloprotease [Nocardia yamanashiensis]UGT42496.1 M48 family metalloprotease [Nocardia yamanashiensis]
MFSPRLASAPRRRRAYRTALRARGYLLSTLTLVIALPAAALAILLIHRLDARLGYGIAYALFALWALAGLALLLMNSRIAAKAVLRPLRDTDPAKLSKVWSEVLTAAGLAPTRRHALWVNEQDRGVEAFVVGGVVAIDHAAARTLRARDLRGVLAHELGHALSNSGNPLRILASALKIPLKTLLRLLFSAIDLLEHLRILPDAGVYTTEVTLFRKATCCAALAAGSAYLIGPLPTLALAAPIALEPVLHHALRRQGERLADRVATDLGYGPNMMSYLEIRSADHAAAHRLPLHVTGPTARALHLLAASTATHPNPQARIAAIERRIRHRETRSPGTVTP